MKIQFIIENYSKTNDVLITNHWNNPPSETALKPTSILSVDIKQDPEGFIKKMCAVVTHLVLESTSMKNQSFLATFNPSA